MGGDGGGKKVLHVPVFHPLQMTCFIFFESKLSISFLVKLFNSLKQKSANHPPFPPPQSADPPSYVPYCCSRQASPAFLFSSLFLAPQPNFFVHSVPNPNPARRGGQSRAEAPYQTENRPKKTIQLKRLTGRGSWQPPPPSPTTATFETTRF